MIDQKLLENKLKEYKQEHLLESMSQLNEVEKQDMINQLLQIDFDEIIKLYESTKEKQKIKQSRITPIDYIDKEKISIKEKQELQKIGEQLIKNDEYAVVTMAGRARNKTRI